MRAVALLFLASWCGVGLAQLNATLTALPDGQWSELSGTAMAAAGPMDIGCCDYGAPCLLRWQGILAYSGATLDETNGRIIVWGGGHNDYFGNQILTFSLASLSWSLETQPTSLCAYGSQPSYRFADGTPVAHHTYDHIDYIPPLNSLFSFAGSSSDAPLYNNGSAYGDVWTYNFASRAWVDHTPNVTGISTYGLSNSLGDSGEYDPVTGLWFHLLAGSVWAFDFKTLAWQQRLEEGPPGIERSTVLDTVRRRLWSYGGDYGGGATLSYYDIDGNTFTVVDSNSEPGPRSAAGLAYDSANDQLVLYGGGPSGHVWNYDIAASSWVQYEQPNSPISPQTYGRFMYDPLHNLFLVIPDVDAVWVWKNQLGGGPNFLFANGFEPQATN